jgi:hypothetical protein
VPPGRSPDQLTAILEMLAGVTSFAAMSIERLMQQESPRLPWGATLVLVTPIVTDGITSMLLNLRKAGRRLALVSLADDPPPHLEGIATYHLPASSRLSAPRFRRFERGTYDATAVMDTFGLTREVRHG